MIGNFDVAFGITFSHKSIMLHHTHNANLPSYHISFLVLNRTPIQQSLRPLIEPLLWIPQASCAQARSWVGLRPTSAITTSTT